MNMSASVQTGRARSATILILRSYSYATGPLLDGVLDYPAHASLILLIFFFSFF